MVDMINNIMIEVMATFAENERESIRKRQREGIDAAVKRGVKFGRTVTCGSYNACGHCHGCAVTPVFVLYGKKVCFHFYTTYLYYLQRLFTTPAGAGVV